MSAEDRCPIEAALDDAELLEQARKAWRDKGRAEGELKRLRNYRGRPSAGMRDDIQRWAELATKSDATLRRILGGAS